MDSMDREYWRQIVQMARDEAPDGWTHRQVLAGAARAVSGMLSAFCGLAGKHMLIVQGRAGRGDFEVEREALDRACYDSVCWIALCCGVAGIDLEPLMSESAEALKVGDVMAGMWGAAQFAADDDCWPAEAALQDEWLSIWLAGSLLFALDKHRMVCPLRHMRDEMALDLYGSGREPWR